MSTAILKIEEGKKRLATLESAAGLHFHNSEEEFSKAIILLLEIQEERLWEYAEDEDGLMLREYENPSFEMYLRLFCSRQGTSRSSVQSYMGVGRLWKALGRDPHELIGIGVRRAKHVEHLVAYDGRKDELKLPPAHVVAQLPAGVGAPVEDRGEPVELPPEKVIERVNRKIDEVLILPEEPLTDEDVRDSFGIDVDEGKVKITFFFAKDSSDVWYTYETKDDMGDGILMDGKVFLELPSVIQGKLQSALRIKRF